MTSAKLQLQTVLNNTLTREQIPGVSVALWHNHQLSAAAAGLLNVDTGVEATPDSVFQIGSITKVLTASLVMKLVEQGRVALDAPVKTYLREFRIADREASNSITVRQLLTHTAGFDGDHYPDDTREMGNLIARYIDRLNLVPQHFAPGEGFTYSNGAYAVAGRLVEVLTGMSYFEAIEEWIYKPLGMHHAVGHPMNTLRYRAAMGHYPRADNPGQWDLAPVCYASLGLAPCGRLTMSASDVIRFARAHMEQGKNASGDAWLSPETIAQMQQAQVALPPHSEPLTAWGLGWMLMAGGPNIAYGHDGLTVGQSSLLRIFPEQNVAIAVQCNCAKPGLLTGIAQRVLSDIVGIDLVAPPAANDAATAEPSGAAANSATTNNATTNGKLDLLTGTYDSLGAQHSVTVNGDQLSLTTRNKVLPVPDTELSLKALDEHSFACTNADGQFAGNCVFMDFNQQAQPQSLFMGLRRNRRIR
jgi:CubicO group peptidase (beta-lactamase class C family)